MSRLVPLERDIEAKFMKLIKCLPIKARKMNGLGFAAWPDRLIVGPAEFSIFIEFKRPGRGKLSEGQKILFAELEEWGHPVLIHTDAREAFDDLVTRLRSHGVQV